MRIHQEKVIKPEIKIIKFNHNVNIISRCRQFYKTIFCLNKLIPTIAAFIHRRILILSFDHMEKSGTRVISKLRRHKHLES